MTRGVKVDSRPAAQAIHSRMPRDEVTRVLRSKRAVMRREEDIWTFSLGRETGQPCEAGRGVAQRSGGCQSEIGGEYSAKRKGVLDEHVGSDAAAQEALPCGPEQLN